MRLCHSSSKTMEMTSWKGKKIKQMRKKSCWARILVEEFLRQEYLVTKWKLEQTGARKMLPYDMMVNVQPFSPNGAACND